jgi:hypothetical protein
MSARNAGATGLPIPSSRSRVQGSQARHVAYTPSGARLTAGSTARRPGRSGRKAAGASGTDPTAVREWAKSQGIEVKDRGRVPAELVVKFKAATDEQ